VLTLTDARNNTTTYTYDDRDNKLTETNAIGKTTTFTYDAKDNLASQSDPLGNVTAVHDAQHEKVNHEAIEDTLHRFSNLNLSNRL
jgi:YD repeat-containing protein